MEFAIDGLSKKHLVDVNSARCWYRSSWWCE